MSNARDLTKKAKARARILLAEKSGWNCYYCGKKLIPDGEAKKYCTVYMGFYTPIDGYDFPEIDHLIPRSRGGLNNIENLVLSCGKCNHTKNEKTEEEFRGWNEKKFVNQ